MQILKIFSYYLPFLKKRIFSQVIIFIGYAGGILGTTILVPLVYKGIIDVVTENPENAADKLMALLLTLVLGILGYNIFFRISDYLIVDMQSKVIKELYDHSLEKLQRHSYVFFSNSFVGGLVAKTKRFVNSFEILHDQIIFHVWMNGVALISLLLVLFNESTTLGAIFLVWLIFYGVLVKFMVKWQIPKSLESAKADTKTNAVYADIITNILTVKMFGSSKREQETFEGVTSNEEKKRTRAWMQLAFWNGMYQSIVIGIFNIIIVWAAVDLWLKGVVSAGTIVLVQVYVLTCFNIVWNISRSLIKASAAVTDASEMIEIFEKEPDVKNPVNPKKMIIKEGEIEFENITFAYKDGESVFNNFNLKIEKGKKVALVGRSGAGKTTVVKLILRFLDLDGGKIKIDGQDITSVTQDDLRKNIAYVPQEPSLFHRTVKENIGYGEDNVSFLDVVEAAKRAQAHDFIEGLPRGYDSLVGERGIKLSGGERQRIAIARAMLKKSKIVILDEATSSLDTLAEEKIQKALLSLTKETTTIIIAHRLSTIKKVDQIIVFEKGEVVETGTHKELLEKKGFYESLWKSQVGGFIK
jgi:ATP-binding cassette, subfamily B, bacterial